MTQHAPADPAAVGRLVRACDPGWRLRRIWPLSGGVSAQVSGIDVEGSGGQRCTLVLREYGAANLRADPHAAATEYRLLQLLSAADLPVPRPYAADESCTIMPGPCLLQEFIDGERIDDPADVAGFTGQLAAALAAVHAAGIARADVPFLADVRDVVARLLGTGQPVASELPGDTAIRAALTDGWPPPQVNEPVVLHGDYWPGNVLWRDGALVGVIDWEDALFGDPLADVAITRLELRLSLGTAAASMFTSQYLALRPGLDVTVLPLWDLRAALRACGFAMSSWGLPAGQLAANRAGLREFAASALCALARPADAVS